VLSVSFPSARQLRRGVDCHAVPRAGFTWRTDCDERAKHPILVTGAAGQVGGIGGLVVSLLLKRQVPVRAFVRRDDERADALRRAGAEIFVGDLTRTEDVARAWTLAAASISA